MRPIRTRTALAAVVALAGAATLAVAAPSASRADVTNSVLSFGGNASGQLGDGTFTQRNSPVQVTGLPIPVVAAVLAGGATGATIATDQTVWTWGDNTHGTLGNGTTGGTRSTAAQVPGLSGITDLSVANGGADVYAVRSSDGTVWAWGANERGQLGTGASTSSPSAVPKQVPGLTGITQVAGGVSYALAVRSDGTVWAWGDNRASQLGDRTTAQRNAPVQVKGLTNIRLVVATSMASFAVDGQGNVYSWGTDAGGSGILGLGPGSVGAAVTGPVRIPDLTNISFMVASTTHVLARTADQSGLYAWGANASGELGDGTTTPSSSPEQLSLTTVDGIATGPGFSAASLHDGSLYTWGDNSHGQLGYGTCCSAVNPTPAKVSAITHAGAKMTAGSDWMLLYGR